MAPYVRQAAQVLEQMNLLHGLQLVGLVAAVCLIIVQLDYPYPLVPRNDASQMRQEFFFARLGLSQFIG